MDSVTTSIDASPEQLYDLVADVTKMGRWSPECYRCRWLGGVSSAEVGARFLGFNRLGRLRWVTLCTVVTATPGSEFAFKVTPSGSTWRYHFEPGPDGSSTVTETRQVHRSPILVQLGNRLLGGNHEQVLVEGMRETLARLKAAAEQA